MVSLNTILFSFKIFVGRDSRRDPDNASFLTMPDRCQCPPLWLGSQRVHPNSVLIRSLCPPSPLQVGSFSKWLKSDQDWSFVVLSPYLARRWLLELVVNHFYARPSFIKNEAFPGLVRKSLWVVPPARPVPIVRVYTPFSGLRLSPKGLLCKEKNSLQIRSS